jgi:nitroreductase
MTKPLVDVTAWQAVTGRRSIRRFLPDEVPEEAVYAVLEGASRAPSGQNMQPWLVHYVTGETRTRLCDQVAADAAAGERSDEYDYFPDEIREPYLSRRRKVGFDLFAIYGVGRGDMEGRKRALLRNFDFFGAPVGLFFVMERNWGKGAWIDMGNFMTNVMTLAPAFGLQTCPQQAWCEYGAAVRRALPVADNHVIVSGMAIGFADPDAYENQLVTERAPPASFVTRHC